jgi:hypothetical protein
MPNDNVVNEVRVDSGQVTIDLRSAEDLAKKFDFSGRDLMIHIDLDFQQETPMNFVVLDPVLFGTSAFIEIIDVATAAESEEFVTVEGFSEQTFDKILTPEANKVVADDVVRKTLAPSQFSYQGLGVFAFPLRIARRLRVTLLMKDPVPNPYERLHVITQENIKKIFRTRSTKRSLF